MKIATQRKAYLLLMTALILAEVAEAFETSMIFAAMSTLIEVYGDPISVGWLITAYMLVGAGTAAIAARLGDIYGRKKCLLALLAAGCLGSIISASFENFYLVLLGRGIQGLTAAVAPICMGIIREQVDDKRVAVSIGLIVSAAGIGTISGLIVGGYIIDNFPWHSIFVASATLAAIAFVFVYFFTDTQPTKKSAAKLDIFGGVLFIPAIAGILLAISKLPIWGWNSKEFIVLIVASIAIFGLWVHQSLRSPNPLINIRLFGNRSILVANIVMALIAVGTLQITQVFSLLMQQPILAGIGLGVSATVAGLVKMPSNVCSLFAGPLTGVLISRLGNRNTTVAASIISGCGWFAAYFFHDSVIQIGLCLIVISFGTTMAFAAVPNIVVASVDKNRTSEAVGMLVVVRSTFMGVGALIISILLSYKPYIDPNDSSVSYASEQGFSLIILAIAASCIAMALISRKLPS